MKKLDFDLAKEAQPAPSAESLSRAKEVLSRYETKFRKAGLQSFWIGARRGVPYIIVSIPPGKTRLFATTIGDYVDDVAVYYIEGLPQLLSNMAS